MFYKRQTNVLRSCGGSLAKVSSRHWSVNRKVFAWLVDQIVALGQQTDNAPSELLKEYFAILAMAFKMSPSQCMRMFKAEWMNSIVDRLLDAGLIDAIMHFASRDHRSKGVFVLVYGNLLYRAPHSRHQHHDMWITRARAASRHLLFDDEP